MATPELHESVGERLHRQLTRHSARTALRLVAADGVVRDVSAGELADRAHSYAVWFRQQAANGQVVGICLYHGRELYAAFIGALWAGATPTMVPPPSPRIERAKYVRSFQHICEYIQPVVLVVDPEAVQALSELDVSSIRMPNIGTPAEIPDAIGERVIAHSLADDVILVQHSSGTTGLQKGVALSNRAVLAHNAAYGKSIGLNTSDVIVSWLPLYHDMGFVACFLMPLLEGVQIVAMSPFDWVRRPLMLLEQIHKYRGTLCWLPNFAFAVLANARASAEAIEALDVSCVRAWINSSEPVTAAATAAFVQRFVSAGVSQAQLTASYAMAENVYAVTQSLPGAHRMLSVNARAFREKQRAIQSDSAGADTLTLVSNGSAVSGTEVRVRVAGARDAEAGEVGEIELRGSYLFSGYFRKPELTAKAMTEDGWYRSGDLGFLYDGELFVTGRLKDLIIVQGRNFYPADLERASEVTGVLPGRVVAFGLADARTGTEGIVILAEADDTSGVAAQDIVAEVRRTIAQEFDCTPSIVKIVAPRWLVKSSSGKLARNDNRDKFLAESQTRSSE